MFVLLLFSCRHWNSFRSADKK